MIIEIITALLLLVGMYLLTVNNKFGFIALIIQNVTLGIIAYQKNLNVLLILEIIFFIMNTEGFIAWQFNKRLNDLFRFSVYILIAISGCLTIFLLDKTSHSVLGLIQVAQLILSIYGQYLVNKSKNGFSYWAWASALMLVICYDKVMIILFMTSVITLALNIRGSILANLNNRQITL